MAFSNDFLDMFPHTILLAPCTGYDSEGAPTYGSDVSYPARISGKKYSLRRQQSNEDSDIFDIWITAGAGVKITVQDRVTLPDQQVFAEDRTPVLFAVARVADEDGQHHVKLQCGWQYHRQGQ